MYEDEARAIQQGNAFQQYLIVLCLVALILASAARLDAQQLEQAIETIREQILASLEAEEKTVIAIVELTDLSRQVTPLGRLVAEEMSGQLFQNAEGRLTLIERSKLDEVLGEQRLSIDGLLEKQNVETFGKALGVEAILTGTVALFEDRVRINTRLIAVPSAELFASASAYLGRLGLPEEYFRPERSPEAGGGNVEAGAAVAVQEFKGIRYELLGCSQKTRLIACTVVLTNNGADRNYSISMWGYTYLYDQRGFQFFPSRIRLVDIEISAGDANRRLISEVPVELKVIFDGTPSSIEFIKILHLRTSDGDIEFRDVRFSE